ncbi:MAG TPA: hypothetical protein VEZ72_10900 [Paenibacillus sp.]|nr:hypothetical protein [Paenibacillus sp.]
MSVRVQGRTVRWKMDLEQPDPHGACGTTVQRRRATHQTVKLIECVLHRNMIL